MNDSTFDSIVADFYRAATGAVEWDSALDRVQQAFGARAVVLHTMDMTDGRLLRLDRGGPNLADAVLTYVRDFHTLDPRRNEVLRIGPSCIGRWMHDHEIFDAAYVAQDPFFQHYLPAYDTRYNANVTIPVGENTVSAFVLELPASRGPLSPDEREVARRLGEHMKDALHAYQRVRDLMSKALAGHTMLSNFPYPMWLMDEGRYIVFENPAGKSEVLREARVAVKDRRLVLRRRRADRELTERLSPLCRMANGDSTVVDLRRHDAETASWLHLSLLVPGAVLGAFGERPLVLATLFDPQQVHQLDTFALANLFKLTPTEAKVAARLADGMTAEQIAIAHGTTIATVRTQTRQVMHKLGVQRSVDVVRVLRQGEVLWSKPAA